MLFTEAAFAGMQHCTHTKRRLASFHEPSWLGTVFLVGNVMLPAFWHLELARKKLREFQNSRREGMEEADTASLLPVMQLMPRKPRPQFPQKQSVGNSWGVPKCLSRKLSFQNWSSKTGRKSIFHSSFKEPSQNTAFVSASWLLWNLGFPHTHLYNLLFHHSLRMKPFRIEDYSTYTKCSWRLRGGHAPGRASPALEHVQVAGHLDTKALCPSPPRNTGCVRAGHLQHLGQGHIWKVRAPAALL